MLVMPACTWYTKTVSQGLNLCLGWFMSEMAKVKSNMTLNPTGFMVACGCWSGSLALAILSPGRFAASFPSFFLLERVLLFWGMEDEIVGCLLFALAIACLWSVTTYASTPWRAFISFISFAIWLLVGTTVVVGGAELGVVNPTGLFCLALAAGCLVSSVQWMNQG